MEPKLKLFFWLLWHDRLPHRKLLTIRKIIQSPMCLRCLTFPEDSPHVIRLCSESKDLWLLTSCFSLSSMSFHSRLELNLESAIHCKGIEWWIIFPYVCHEIWKDWNNRIFRAAFATEPNNIISKVLLNARKFLLAVPNQTNFKIAQIENHSGNTP